MANIIIFLCRTQRIGFIENSLQRGMEHLYREGLATKNVDIVANCLRTYAAIDRVSEAEMLYRVQFVRPAMAKVASPSPKTSHSMPLHASLLQSRSQAPPGHQPREVGQQETERCGPASSI